MPTWYTLAINFEVDGDWQDTLAHASKNGEQILSLLKADQWMLLSMDGDLCWKEHMEQDKAQASR